MNSNDHLNRSIYKGIIWTYSERMFSQGLSLLLTIILARLLLPEHYGIISVVTIIINFLNVFVLGGFGKAIIQKKHATDIDYSTTLIFSTIMGLVLYVALFLIAPFISDFYDNPELDGILKVLGLMLPIGGINSVQFSILEKKMQFRKLFYVSFGAIIVSSILGIFCAYLGYGVWSLVVQQLSVGIITTIILLIVQKFIPKLKFSIESMKSLFGFGWKILVVDILNTLSEDVRGLSIGSKYNIEDLAYYNKGLQFPKLIVGNINTSITKVLFPALSNNQENLSVVKETTRKLMKISIYFLYPFMMGLFVVAEDFTSVILTDKWLPIVPYMRIMCLAFLLQPITTANLQVYKALGKSEINLKLSIIKNIIGFSILIITVIVFDSPIYIAIGFAIEVFINFIINMYPNTKVINYSYKEQLMDVLPTTFLAIVMACSVFMVKYLLDSAIVINNIMSLLFQAIIGLIIYVFLSFVFKNEVFINMLKYRKVSKK